MIDQTPPPLPTEDRPLPRTSTDPFEPLEPGAPTLAVLDALLKTPNRIFADIQAGRSVRIFLQMTCVILICLTAYGVVAGVFSAGWQTLLAPVKIILCVGLSALLCLPSLYIFTALSKVDIRLDALVAHGSSALALTSILLLGLTPVLFVFTVSTSSLGFMGLLHITLWMIAGLAGCRFLFRIYRHLGDQLAYVVLWQMIFITVLLQMSTTLRPILGPATRIIDPEKQFFLIHWLRTLAEGA